MDASEPAHMLFVGVTTKASFVHHVFDGWASCLGKPLFLESRDVPLGASRDTYRRIVSELRQGYPNLRGALITSHKAGVFDSAADLFDCLSDDTTRLGEIGMIYWADGKFCSGANDVISTQRVVARMLSSSRNWLDGCRKAVILGAGGAGIALASTLSTVSEVMCTEITIVECDAERAEKVLGITEQWHSSVPIRVVHNGGTSDELVQQAGTGSLIVNATGLGKDKPGSPISAMTIFPKRSFIWEFNYRFLPQETPTFLELATAQVSERELTIEDGWDYFIWGWLGVMYRVLALDNPLDVYHPCFLRVAEAVRK